MGCCKSKTTAIVAGGKDCDSTPNELSGLSECDCKILKESWDEINKTGQEYRTKHGVDFFIRLVEGFPSLKDHFPEVEFDVDSPELENMGKELMDVIDSWIGHSSNAERLITFVRSELSESPLRAIFGTDKFDDLESMYVPWIRSILEDRFTKGMDTAWTRLINCHTATLKSVIEEEIGGEEPVEED